MDHGDDKDAWKQLLVQPQRNKNASPKLKLITEIIATIQYSYAKKNLNFANE